tara:strand:+ start:484 stop:645 length:162 start_codon:yes stop_codon:yes gene_type:complete
MADLEKYKDIIEALLEELKEAEDRLEVSKGCSNYEYYKNEFINISREVIINKV